MVVHATLTAMRYDMPLRFTLIEAACFYYRVSVEVSKRQSRITFLSRDNVVRGMYQSRRDIERLRRHLSFQAAGATIVK